MEVEVFDFGARLKELRESKGMTQAQVADKIGLSRSLLSEYEAGIRLPTTETLPNLAAIYGTSADYMLGLKNEIVINTNGLNKSQRDALLSVMNTLCDEFNKANKAGD